MPVVTYLIALVALLAAGAARAETLATTNQSTLARSFALPALGQLTRPARSEWRGALDLTTEYALDQDDAEELLLDGETQRYSLAWRRAFGSAFDASVEVPLLHTGGGFMDDLIQDWHDFFSLPNGGRELAPDDRYQYRYTRDGLVQFDSREHGTQLGDVLLGAGYALREGWMLRATVKLPTGDEDRLSGGTWGGALHTEVALPFPQASRVGGFVAAGLSLAEDGPVLAAQQQNLVPFGGLGLDVRVLERWTLIGQLYAHAPLYKDTEIDALQRPGVTLTLGTRWCYSARQCAEVSFGEDLAVASSPDFSLRFALRVR